MISRRVQSLRNYVEQLKGRKNQLEEELRSVAEKVKVGKHSLRHHVKAREVIREVGLKTQQQLQVHISDITSLALDSVFKDSYSLLAEFVQRRNKTECDLYFKRGENKISPLSASGGGAVDIAAFALRVASWSMQDPRKRNVIVLDEPFKHLSTNLLPLAGEMVKQVSERLDLQIIMVTHAEELIDAANKVFYVSMRGGVSIVLEKLNTPSAIATAQLRRRNVNLVPISTHGDQK